MQLRCSTAKQDEPREDDPAVIVILVAAAVVIAAGTVERHEHRHGEVCQMAGDVVQDHEGGVACAAPQAAGDGRRGWQIGKDSARVSRVVQQGEGVEGSGE